MGGLKAFVEGSTAEEDVVFGGGEDEVLGTLVSYTLVASCSRRDMSAVKGFGRGSLWYWCCPSDTCYECNLFLQ